MLISLSMTSEPEYITINGYPGITMQDGDRATVAWVIGEVNKETKKGNKVLITTLTKKMAEDLTKYLKSFVEMCLCLHFLPLIFPLAYAAQYSKVLNHDVHPLAELSLYCKLPSFQYHHLHDLLLLP